MAISASAGAPGPPAAAIGRDSIARWPTLTVALATFAAVVALMATPAFLSRLAAVACLASGPALILLVFRLAIAEDESDPDRSRNSEHDDLRIGQSFA